MSEPELVGDFAAFKVAGAGGAIAVEDNGYQGTREAVLALASKAAANRKAASIFWNVNGVVRFTCAAKGKLVASVELGMVDDPEDLPAALRKLAALSESDDADLVAVGAAMVEKYTGTTFFAEDLAGLDEWYLLEPPLDVLPTVTEESASLVYCTQHGGDPNIAKVLAGIGTLDAARQRHLAHWVAEIAFDQAALGEEGARYASVVASLDGDAVSPVPPSLIVYMQKVERAWSAGHTELAVSDTRWFPDRSLRWLGQVHLMGVALRYAMHPDPATAVWECVYNASRSLGFPSDRATTGAGRMLYPAVLRYIEDPDMSKSTFLGLFPLPPRPEDRRAELDEERAVYVRERGEWDEVWGGMGEDTGPIEPFGLPR